MLHVEARKRQEVAQTQGSLFSVLLRSKKKKKKKRETVAKLKPTVKIAQIIWLI